jgi:gliding motility-associated protein GldC
MKKEIKFTVTLDENHIPEKLEWLASEEDGVTKEQIKALMISVWDGNEKVAKRIDLWTKEMMVDEMKYFHFQTLMTLADSLEQSTKENVVAEKMRKFGMQIGKEMDILTK